MNKCENCSSTTGPFHTIHWQSIGEVELYCQKCYDQELGTTGGIMLPDPDEPAMTDAELESILQL
jgi:hypothetical protein